MTTDTYIPNLNSPSTVIERLIIECIKLAQFQVKHDDLVALSPSQTVLEQVQQARSKVDFQLNVVKATMDVADHAIYDVIEKKVYRVMDEKRTFTN